MVAYHSTEIKNMKPTQLIILFLFSVSAKTLSAARQPQWKGTVFSETIKGRTADEVWPFFEDFCNLYKIYPIDVSFCTLPLTRPLSRYLATEVVVPSTTGDNSTIINWERQQVLVMNSKKRLVTYKRVETNQQIKTYTATATILDKKDGCQIKDDFVLDPQPGYIIDDVKNNNRLILAYIVAKIEKLLSKPT